MSLHDCVKLYPFPHAYCPYYISNEDVGFIYQKIRDGCEWKLGKTKFYEQWEGITNVSDISVLREYFSTEFIFKLKNEISSAFGRTLSDDLQINIHRMTSGQRLGIHTDEPRLGYETHRALIYFNNENNPYAGGEFLAFSERDITSSFIAYRPMDGSLIAFEASEKSYHAVMPIDSGERIAVQFYFWHIGNDKRVAKAVQIAISESLQAAKSDDFILSIISELKGEKNAFLQFGSTILLEHLTEVGCLLKSWGCKECLVVAGLLHAIFGNTNYKVKYKVSSEVIVWQCSRPDISVILRCYDLIRDHNDLVDLYRDDGELFQEVILLWLANVISGRRHVVFSYDEWEFEYKMLESVCVNNVLARKMIDSIYPGLKWNASSS